MSVNAIFEKSGLVMEVVIVLIIYWNSSLCTESVVNESDMIRITDSKASLAFSLTSMLSCMHNADNACTLEDVYDVNNIIEYFCFEHEAS